MLLKPTYYLHVPKISHTCACPGLLRFKVALSAFHSGDQGSLWQVLFLLPILSTTPSSQDKEQWNGMGWNTLLSLVTSNSEPKVCKLLPHIRRWQFYKVPRAGSSFVSPPPSPSWRCPLTGSSFVLFPLPLVAVAPLPHRLPHRRPRVELRGSTNPRGSSAAKAPPTYKGIWHLAYKAVPGVHYQSSRQVSRTLPLEPSSMLQLDLQPHFSTAAVLSKTTLNFSGSKPLHAFMIYDASAT